MTNIKIESVPVNANHSVKVGEQITMKDFCIALNALEVGQSFVLPLRRNPFSTVMTIAKHLTGKVFVSRSIGSAIRVGRVS